MARVRLTDDERSALETAVIRIASGGPIHREDDDGYRLESALHLVAEALDVDLPPAPNTW